jgi:hypothetical protein
MKLGLFVAAVLFVLFELFHADATLALHVQLVILLFGLLFLDNVSTHVRQARRGAEQQAGGITAQFRKDVRRMLRR